MGHIEKGILGGFSGKVGPVVGANWRGIDVIRSKPKKSKRAATEAQLEQQAKFGIVVRFLAPLKKFITRFYGVTSGFRSRANLATSYHIREAIMGTYPNFSMNYPKVVISKGELLGVEELQVVPGDGGELDFSWFDNSGNGLAKPEDNLIVVLYEESTDTLRIIEKAAKRSEEAFNTILPAFYTGLKVHCWITFASADAKIVANSVYMGEIQIG